MSRGLTGTVIDNLELQNYIVETLVEFTNGNNFAYYMTNGAYDIELTTATSNGAQTYDSNIGLTVIDEIPETYLPSSTTATINFSTNNSNLLEDLSSNILNTNVVIYKLFRDTTTNDPDISDGYNVFTGSVTGVDYFESTESKTLNVRCQSLFSDFNRTYGRRTSDFPMAQYNTTQLKWGTIIARS